MVASASPVWGVTQACGITLMSRTVIRHLVPEIGKAGDSHIARSAIDDILRSGYDRAVLDELVRLNPVWRGSEMTILPPMFGEMLKCLGVDPHVALALSLASGCGLSVLEDVRSGSAQQILNINLATRDVTWVALGLERSSWREDCILMPRIPDSVRTALVGKPLRRLLSHPALDAHAITMTAFRDCWGDDDMMEVETDLHAAWSSSLPA